MVLKFIAINGTRDGYGPDQCHNSLTVGELIEALKEFDEDLPIYLVNDGGYTYGSMTEPYEEVYGEEDEEDEE